MSVSLLNCAILPNTGRYWFETSSGGATIRKKNFTGFSSMALKSTPGALPPERDAQLVDHERAAVRDGDLPADAGGAEVLAPLEHLEERRLVLVVDAEQPDELLEDVVLDSPLSSSWMASSVKNSRNSTEWRMGW